MYWTIGFAGFKIHYYSGKFLLVQSLAGSPPNPSEVIVNFYARYYTSHTMYICQPKPKNIQIWIWSFSLLGNYATKPFQAITRLHEYILVY